jgi:hypothetical protein
MTDEQLDAALEALRALLAERAGEAANVLEGTAEAVALTAPEAQSEPTPAHLAHLTTPPRGDFWILKMSFGAAHWNCHRGRAFRPRPQG